MTFTENLYLKRQLQQLQEENLKLKKILTEISDQEADSLMASHHFLHTRVDQSNEVGHEDLIRRGVITDRTPRTIDPKTGEYVPIPPSQGNTPPRPGPSQIPDTALSRTNPKSRTSFSVRNENNQNYETPAAFGYSASGAVDRVLRGGKRLEDMTPEEAFQHGQDHSMLQGVSTPAHFFKNPHFAAGFNSTK
jgi:hypothetical protein